jgi:uncharacterized membrane protein YcjF (UPF0283 family)
MTEIDENEFKSEIDMDELDKGSGTRFLSIFTTTSWPIYALTVLMMIIMIGLLIWTLIEFYNAQTTIDMIFWGFHIVAIFIICAFIELWVWLEMNRVSVLRELKRLDQYE